MEKSHSGTRMFLLRALFIIVFVFVVNAGLTVAAESPKESADSSAPPAAAKNAADNKKPADSDAVKALQSKLADQQTQIEKLTRAVELLTQRLNASVPSVSQTASSETAQPASVGQVSSLVPVIPAAAASAPASLSVPASPGAAPASAAQVEQYQQKVDALSKTLDGLSKGLGGFKFSGDLRFRTDAILRSSNSVAGPAQNVRERYRVRFNVNKDVAPQFGFHLQLGTGTANNPTTYDSDFTGANTRGFLWLTQYYGDYHPNKHLSIRAGKMDEVFADGEKFLYDDDIEFNGLHEIAKAKISDNASIEFRAGQYVFTNPNVQILPSAANCSGASPSAACAFVKAGYEPGQKVRDANLFDQGAVISAKSGDNWKHEFTASFQLFRNPNQLLMGSSSSNASLLVNGYTGLTLSGGVGQAGNGTTTAGGFIYTASSYHVGHVGYKVEYDGWKSSRQSWPLVLDVQAAHNFGGTFQHNAWMGVLSLGSVKKSGDVRFLYGYYVKEANSMISEISDDDISTGPGVNTRTHYLRVDLGLSKYLQWQNLLYIQNEIAGSDPARNFFVPSPARGAATQYRAQSQFQINF
jgi:uncharacterized coiled-coil protein SlyX